MTICIIPARSGSKRIKNKNIINFFGKPLIYYAIKTAIKSKIFKRVLVSTDSRRIKKIAIKYGAECPFLREKKLSNDKASSKDVLIDCIKRIKSNNSKYHCLFYPTSPLIKKNDLIKAYNIIKSNKKANSLMCVSEAMSNPLRSLYIKKKNLKFKWKKYQKINSQDLQKLFYDTGSFYYFKTKEILKSKKFLLDNTIPFILPREKSIDLNDRSDLKILKFFFRNK
jgi:pseudaminic acid cytidylyltransferase